MYTFIEPHSSDSGELNRIGTMFMEMCDTMMTHLIMSYHDHVECFANISFAIGRTYGNIMRAPNPYAVHYYVSDFVGILTAFSIDVSGKFSSIEERKIADTFAGYARTEILPSIDRYIAQLRR